MERGSPLLFFKFQMRLDFYLKTKKHIPNQIILLLTEPVKCQIKEFLSQMFPKTKITNRILIELDQKLYPSTHKEMYIHVESLIAYYLAVGW